jgi:periplasmic protein TonB
VISFDAPLLSADGKGSVGLNDGAGQGSATQIRKSSGGGGGGNRNRNPAQTGAVPPPADIPAPIDNLTRKNPALPLAGIKLDPVLWKPMPLAQYGDPRSTSLTHSNGPGTEGGMGNENGQGIGEGDGRGLGPGEKGNTGGGPMESGWGRSGGNSCATRICVGHNRVFPSREVEERARVLFKPEPQYTEEARRNQISGTVTLRVVFSRAGEVTDIRALHALPFGLTERAIAAARQIRFVPAKRGGQAVSVFMQLEYNFNLY